MKVQGCDQGHHPEPGANPVGNEAGKGTPGEGQAVPVGSGGFNTRTRPGRRRVYSARQPLSPAGGMSNVGFSRTQALQNPRFCPTKNPLKHQATRGFRVERQGINRDEVSSPWVAGAKSAEDAFQFGSLGNILGGRHCRHGGRRRGQPGIRVCGCPFRCPLADDGCRGGIPDVIRHAAPPQSLGQWHWQHA